MTNNDIVQKLWNLCDVLRDDGINYSDYVTELVLLLFIKMVHENTEAGTLQKHPLPEGCRWTDLAKKSGTNLLRDYQDILRALATGKRTMADAEDPSKTIEVQVHNDPLITAIYDSAQTRLREPRHLEQMIKTLDQIDWFSAQKDGLGDLYEGLLEKNANETKSGAGQYFTPRALINTMVRCLKPQPGERIQDPAAGTAGFLIAAHEYIRSQPNFYDLTLKEYEFQKYRAYVGIELVPGAGLEKADVILANPPFGTSKGGDASITRDDLTYKTSNKQLAFLQHIYRNLKPGGRAAVVLPDNVLFEAGVGTDVRRDLMNKCNLHTILRLPTGIFYAQGVKTNVLFFTKGSTTDKYQEENCTEHVWVYDLRTNMPSFGKRTPFGDQHLKPFEDVYDDSPNGDSERKEGEYSFHSEDIELPEHSDENEGIDPRLAHSRWRSFSRQWIAEHKGDSLDISWLKDSDSVDAANLPEPSVLASEAMGELVQALGELDALMRELGAEEEADGAGVLLREVMGGEK